MASTKIILGIDPGTNLLGYGIIEVQGSKLKLITLGELRLAKYENHGDKLLVIFNRICELIEGYQVQEVSIEAPFFGKNVQSMLKLGRAQGVAIAAAISKGLQVYEYEPRKVKQSVTGSGSATKAQVASMLQKLLNTTIDNETLDATDGLAVALCHHFQFAPQVFGSKKGKNDWKSFIANNSDKLKK